MTSFLSGVQKRAHSPDNPYHPRPLPTHRKGFLSGSNNNDMSTQGAQDSGLSGSNNNDMSTQGTQDSGLSGNNNNVMSTQGTQGNEDYVDKGLDAFEKKEGLPDNRGMNEKITDGARSAFENVTGQNVSSKISN
ncbi:hypothetical protein GGX14DRAFT_467891 [Mycena pura]|uniref:Uncharacterized protein n=1 Tax=Mycena pura TaxID=153505 RepID=A0AAD6V4H9_9AGAR|nr:hypothetical protein GGX14DRAFT_467891 [Mycena pura]